MFLALTLLSACKQEPATPATPPLPIPVIVPLPTPPSFVPPSAIPLTAPRESVRGHAQECANVLGPIPGFDCIADALPVPVTVDGVVPETNPSECDTPSLLESSCNLFTRAGRKQGTHRDGTPRPEVEFVFTCRSSDDAEATEEGGIYHDVAMIGHNSETGATCYFQSFPDDRIRFFPSPMTAGGAPDYGETDADDIWMNPNRVADINCHRCHSADPWIHSPWIDQVDNPESPGDILVPWTELDSPYHVVGAGFDDWELDHFDLPNNPCTSCHRIGSGGCDEFVAYSAGDPAGLPLSETTDGDIWMPPDFTGTLDDWEEGWRAHVVELQTCCNSPNLPGCNLTPTPAGSVFREPEGPSGPVPECATPDEDLGSDVGTALRIGSTCGTGHDYPQECGEDGSLGEDIAFLWTAPIAATFQFDTLGSNFDTTLTLRQTCDDGNAEQGCNDDEADGQQSVLSRPFLAGETVVVVVDGYDGAACGSYVLSITAL